MLNHQRFEGIWDEYESKIKDHFDRKEALRLGNPSVVKKELSERKKSLNWQPKVLQ